MARFIIVLLAAVVAYLVLAEARPQILTPPAWVVGTWRLEEIRGLPVVHNATTTIYPDGILSGSTACNAFSARAKFLGARLFLSQITHFSAFCLEKQRMLEEGYFLKALLPAERARLDPDGALVLNSKTGGALIKFSRIGDAPGHSHETSTFHPISGNLK